MGPDGVARADHPRGPGRRPGYPRADPRASPSARGATPTCSLGMLDRDADLRAVRTADKQLHYVLAENLPEFKKTHQVVEDEPAWEGGQRGVLTAQRAREEGFAKLIADNPAEVANAYHLAGQSAANDPTLGQVVKPGLDPDRRADRHGQEVVPAAGGSSRPGRRGSTSSSSRSTARAGSTPRPTASPT